MHVINGTSQIENSKPSQLIIVPSAAKQIGGSINTYIPAKSNGGRPRVNRMSNRSQLERETRKLQITLQELTTLPPGRRIYEKRGSLFYLVPKKDVLKRTRARYTHMKAGENLENPDSKTSKN
ncbi:hypothetical protein AAMO2058_000195300 [Amorphochlora amoebiformis]